jgi:ADP-ribose pyrophosphatase
MLRPNWKGGTQFSVKDRDDWQVLDTRSLFKNSYVEVFQEKVVPPGEHRVRTWTTVRRKKAVVIAPVTPEGNVVLIHQARIPIRKLLWEFPAGQVDDSMEPDMPLLKETALRELIEETGYELAPGGDLVFLGHYYTSQGYSDETNYLFLARPVRKTVTGSNHDESESIVECREFSFAQLREMIADHIIQDANTLALYARLAAKGFVSFGGALLATPGSG